MPSNIHKHPLLQAMPLCLVLFIDGIGLGLLFPIFSFLFLNHHVNFLPAMTTDATRTFLFGATAGTFMLCWFFGASIIGDLSDAIGRKKSLVVCLLGACIGYGLTAIAILMHSITLIILGRIIAGFTAGSQPVAQAAMVDIAPKGKTAAYISYVLLAMSIGFMLGPLLGGVLSNHHLVSWFNLATPLWFAAAISFANIFLLVLFYQEEAFPHRKIAINIMQPVILFLDAFRFHAIRTLSVIYFIFQIAWANIYSFISLFAMRRFHMGINQTSYVLTCLGLGFAIGMIGLVQWLSNRFEIKKIVYVNWILSGFITVAILLTPTETPIWFLMILLGITLGVSYANVVTLFSKQVGEDRQGWIMGITGAMGALAFGVVEFVASPLVRFGDG